MRRRSQPPLALGPAHWGIASGLPFCSSRLLCVLLLSCSPPPSERSILEQTELLPCFLISADCLRLRELHQGHSAPRPNHLWQGHRSAGPGTTAQTTTGDGCSSDVAEGRPGVIAGGTACGKSLRATNDFMRGSESCRTKSGRDSAAGSKGRSAGKPIAQSRSATYTTSRPARASSESSGRDPQGRST
jgi:hypothetical protein